MKEITLFFFFLILLTGCEGPGQPSPEEKIIIRAPLNGQVYQEGEPVFFDALFEGVASCDWVSSLDGFLGHSLRFARELSEGNHLITLQTSTGDKDSVEITIQPPLYRVGKSIIKQLNGRENGVTLPPGRYAPLVYSLGTSPYSTFLKEKTSEHSAAVSQSSFPPEDDFFSLKTGVDRIVSRNPTGRLDKKSGSRDPMGLKPSIGEVRDFIVADTDTSGYTSGTVAAELYFQSPAINLWLDRESKRNEQLLNRLWENIRTLCLDRVRELWGEWEDINNNGGIDILITPKINREERAVGFFNTNDFYPFCSDPVSEEYNPCSNGMDIVYLGDPSENPEQFAYSVPSLSATFCHELFHLIHYSRKVYIPYAGGEAAPEGEELYLDEGLAHLTESLCGFGESGGNMAFFSRYLAEPYKYSLKENDLNGDRDSVGKRGALSAFLCWLFWLEGGYEEGGKIFLKRLQNSNYTGWENISYALGRDADRALEEWFRFLNEASWETRNIHLDPVTGEAVNMDPFLGTYIINGQDFSLRGPQRVYPDEPRTLLPYGAVWFKTIEPAVKQSYLIGGENNSGYSSAVFYMTGP